MHTISPINGHQKDALTRTDDNSELIDKWLDEDTECLYMATFYRNGKAESMIITKEFFYTICKNMDI